MDLMVSSNDFGHMADLNLFAESWDMYFTHLKPGYNARVSFPSIRLKNKISHCVQ